MQITFEMVSNAHVRKLTAFHLNVHTFNHVNTKRYLCFRNELKTFIEVCLIPSPLLDRYFLVRNDGL